eukprot:g1618.t1
MICHTNKLLPKLPIRVSSFSFRLRVHGCPFEVLGLERNASREEARAAYVEKMKQIHPDITSEDTNSLATSINLAYEQILNEISTNHSESNWNRKDVFDMSRGVPEIAFVNPFRCINVNPMEWRKLQSLDLSNRSIEDSLFAAGVTFSESAICYLTPEQMHVVETELERMELTLDFESCQWYLNDCLTRAQKANSKMQ